MGVNQLFQFADVEALRVGRHGDRVNTSCILYRLGDTLIDTGPANQWGKVRRFLGERKVERVLLTHHHEDHSGNGAKIAKHCHAQIFAQEQGLDFCAKGFPLPFYRRVVWGKPKRFQAKPLPAQMEMSGGFSLETVHCPGHAPDMTCFLEKQRGWLFSGDLYISQAPKFLRKGEDPNQEIKSLEHALTHDFEVLFCAHRGVIEKGREVLTNKWKYLISIREQVQYYLGKGHSQTEIRKRILGKEAFLTVFSLGEFSKRNYIDAFAADTALCRDKVNSLV